MKINRFEEIVRINLDTFDNDTERNLDNIVKSCMFIKPRAKNNIESTAGFINIYLIFDSENMAISFIQDLKA